MTTPDLPDWQTRVALTADELLFSGQLAVNGSTPVLNVSQYQSVLVSTSQQAATGAQVLALQWLDTALAQISQDYGAALPDALGVVLPPVQSPVRGPNVQVTNLGAAAQTVKVYGSIRPLTRTIVTGYAPQSSDATGVVSWTNGVAQQVGASYPGVQGLAQAEFRVGATTLTGEFFAQVPDANGNAQVIRLATTVEAASLANNLVICKQVILPQNVYTLRFLPRATVASVNVSYSLIPLGG